MQSTKLKILILLDFLEKDYQPWSRQLTLQQINPLHVALANFCNVTSSTIADFPLQRWFHWPVELGRDYQRHTLKRTRVLFVRKPKRKKIKVVPTAHPSFVTPRVRVRSSHSAPWDGCHS